MSIPAVDVAHASERIEIGDLVLFALSDGEFQMPRTFLSDPSAHASLAGPDGIVRLPIGAFLLPGETPVLIDAGLGPIEFGGPKVGLADEARLVGGNLITQLESQGVRPEDIATLTFSHLHVDHTGWVATREGEPVFPNARVLVHRADWEHFVEGNHMMQSVRSALSGLAERGRVELFDSERSIVRGLTAYPAPGHTPGHTVFVVHDGPERATLLGDAMYCPQQMTELEWAAVSDADPALARRTREALMRELESSGGSALGCHFPGLRAARLLGGKWV